MPTAIILDSGTQRVAYAIAFGGVATGNMKAHEETIATAMATGSTGIPSCGNSGTTSGNSNAANAVLDTSSVAKFATNSSTPIMSTGGVPASAPANICVNTAAARVSTNNPERLSPPPKSRSVPQSIRCATSHDTNLFPPSPAGNTKRATAPAKATIHTSTPRSRGTTGARSHTRTTTRKTPRTRHAPFADNGSRPCPTTSSTACGNRTGTRKLHTRTRHATTSKIPPAGSP